jgi:hypothetical protein
VRVWGRADSAVGDELSRRVEEAGEYYLSSENLAKEEPAAIVLDSVVDGKLLMTFDTGAVLEAWYVAPRVPPRRKPTAR